MAPSQPGDGGGVTACLIHRPFLPPQHFNNFPWALLNPSRVNCKARNKKRPSFQAQTAASTLTGWFPLPHAQLLWLSASVSLQSPFMRLSHLSPDRVQYNLPFCIFWVSPVFPFLAFINLQVFLLDYL